LGGIKAKKLPENLQIYCLGWQIHSNSKADEGYD